MRNIVDSLKILYTKDSYYKKYGKDAIIAMGIIYIFLAIGFYFHILNHIPGIRQNWPKNRCNPLYLPLAGIIMKDPKKTNMAQIQDNFAFCTQNILISIINVFLEPIFFAITLMISTVSGTLGSFVSLRSILSYIRNALGMVTNNVNKNLVTSNIAIMRQTELMKAFTHKTIGVLAAGMYELFGLYFTLKSFAGSIIQIIYEGILIPIGIAYFSALNNPITAILVAPSLLASYIAIQIPTLAVQTIFIEILKIQKIHIESL